MQEHPDPQSSAMLELRDFHAESPPGSPSGSAMSGREFKRELTPVQENLNETGDATPKGKSTTPRQSSLQGEESTARKRGSQPTSASHSPTSLGSEQGGSKAEQPGHQKHEEVAKSVAGEADGKGGTDSQSIGQRVKDAVHGLKHKFGSLPDRDAKVELAIVVTALDLY